MKSKKKKKIINLLKDNPLTLGEISSKLNQTKTQCKKDFKELRNNYNVIINKETTRGKTLYFVPLRMPPSKPVNVNIDYFAMVSDTHLGDKYAEEECLADFYDICYEGGIKNIFHCLTRNSILITKNGSMEINKIKKNDQILDINGKFQKILQIHKRKSKIITLKLKNFKEIECSLDHPFLAIKSQPCPYKYINNKKHINCNPECCCVNSFSKYKNKKYSCKSKLFKKYKREFISADKLKEGDFLCVPKLKEKKITKDLDLMRLYGYFVGDGYASKGGIQITQNIIYPEIIEDIIKCCNKIKKPKIYKYKTYVRITINSKEIAKSFRNIFYRNNKKFIPNEFLFLNKYEIKEFIIGLIKSDGHINRNRIRIDNSNKDIIYKTILLLAKLGIFADFTKNSSATKYKPSNYSYRLEIRGNANAKIFEYLKRERKDNLYWQDQNYVYIPIQKKSYSKKEKVVYNLTIENSHTYIADAFCSHNCGDIGDGIGVYEGQLLDLKPDCLTLQDQINYIIKNYPKKKNIKVKLISGNHDIKQYKRQGIDIAKAVSDGREDIEYIGQMYGRIRLKDDILLELSHPTGNKPYSSGYKFRTYLRERPINNYPDMLALGHLHSSLFEDIQGTQAYMLGCFLGDTEFTRRRGMNPSVGGWIIELKIEGGRIKRCKSEWVKY